MNSRSIVNYSSGSSKWHKVHCDLTRLSSTHTHGSRMTILIIKKQEFKSSQTFYKINPNFFYQTLNQYFKSYNFFLIFALFFSNIRDLTGNPKIRLMIFCYFLFVANYHNHSRTQSSWLWVSKSNCLSCFSLCRRPPFPHCLPKTKQKCLRLKCQTWMINCLVRVQSGDRCWISSSVIST